jgi:hypothetical protein
MRWNELVSKFGTRAAHLMHELREAKADYDKWQSFRAGRDNATIASDLVAAGDTEVDSTYIAELDACIAAFKELYDLADNVAVAQGDRLYSMNKFA